MAAYGMAHKRVWCGGRGDVVIFHMNVLAQSLAFAPCVENSTCAFPHVKQPEVVFDRARRYAMIVNVLLEHAPDVICLAEVDDTHFNALVIDLAGHAYVGMFQRKEASDARDGTAIFFKTTTIACLSVHSFAIRPPESQVAMFALFAMRRKNKSFIVAATHLKAKGGFEDRRKEQCMAIFNALGNFRRTHAALDTPVFFVGDLNDVRDSPCIKYIERHAFALKSAYDAFYTDDSAYYTTYKKRDVEVRRVIDYIFHQHKATMCVGASLIPQVSSFPDLLPAVDYPSDHLSIAAGFTFTE